MHHIDVLMAPPDQPAGKTKLLGKWGTSPYPGAKGPDRTLIYKSTSLRLSVVSRGAPSVILLRGFICISCCPDLCFYPSQLLSLGSEVDSSCRSLTQSS